MLQMLAEKHDHRSGIVLGTVLGTASWVKPLPGSVTALALGCRKKGLRRVQQVRIVQSRLRFRKSGFATPLFVFKNQTQKTICTHFLR